MSKADLDAAMAGVDDQGNLLALSQAAETSAQQ